MVEGAGQVRPSGEEEVGVEDQGPLKLPEGVPAAATVELAETSATAVIGQC